MKIADIPKVLFDEYADPESVVSEKGEFNQNVLIACLKNAAHIVLRIEAMAVRSSLELFHEDESREGESGSEYDRMLLSINTSQLLDLDSWVQGKGYKISESLHFDFPFLGDSPRHGFSLRHKEADRVFTILYSAALHAKLATSVDGVYQADLEPNGDYSEDIHRKEGEAIRKRYEEVASRKWWHRFLPGAVRRSHRL